MCDTYNHTVNYQKKLVTFRNNALTKSETELHLPKNLNLLNILLEVLTKLVHNEAAFLCER